MQEDYDFAVGRKIKTQGRPANNMRYAAMQALTWGTIVGAIVSALLLAALETPVLRYAVELPDATSLSSEPTQAGRARPKSPSKEAPNANSIPQLANQ